MCDERRHPAAYLYNSVTLTDLLVGGGGGGSGLCGPLPGDATSTQCGTNALTNLAGTTSNLSGFGANAVSSLTGENSQDIGVGANAASDLSTVQNLVAIGNNAGSSSTECGDVVGVGDNASSICSGSVQVVGVGDGTSSIISTGSSDIVGVGDNTSSNITNSQNVVGMGDGASSNISNSETVIGIGNSASSNISAGSSEIIGLGDLSVSNVDAGSDDIIGIGNCAAAALGAASSDVIQIGHSAVCGYSDTVYTDSIAIGNNQITASDQIIIGDAAITQLVIWGTGDGCLSSASGVVTGSGSLCGSTSGGVTSINTVAGAFTFSFSSGAGSCSGTTCTFTGSGSGGGSVTNVIAGTLPSWLGLTVATSTTTPTLNFTASAIPNSSLANASTTVNGQTCTLGSTCTISAGGSVTSVGLAMPSIFSVSGSPVTSTGTLTAALTNETADFVFAGPCGGSAASPTFRALCAGDLPLATTSAFGAVKPDNATILVSAGVISVGTIPYTSVSGLGTFATQNYATPPAIGGTIPAAGAFSSLTDTGAASSAGLNCLQINNVGVISNTGSVCGAGGGGTQLQVNGGAVLVTANLSNTIPAAGTGYQNVIWQNTGASVSAEVPYATGSVFGIIKPDGTTCSVTTGVLTCGGAATLWSAINNPTTSLSLTMLHYPTTFTFDATTGSGAMMTWQDTASNTGTGPIALFQTSSGSTALPWEALANGVGWKVGTNGALVSVGSTTHGITIPAGTAVSGLSANVIYASDATNGYAEVNENNTGLSRICTAANSVCAGAPGGTSGQLQYNNSGAFAGFTMSGDATVVPSTGIITVTKSNGTSFGTAAFVNTGTSGGTVPLLNTLDVFSGGIHYTKGGSASFSPIYDTGTPFTGGSATTNWPQVYFDYNTGSEPSWDAAGAGTVFGMNLPPGFGGAAIDIYAAGTDVFQVYSSGNTYALGYYLSSNGFKVTGGAEVQLYRCTTAGTLRVGQVTSVAADCGASNATGVYVN